MKKTALKVLFNCSKTALKKYEKGYCLSRLKRALTKQKLSDFFSVFLMIIIF